MTKAPEENSGAFWKGGNPTKKKVLTIIIAIVAFILALGLTLYPLFSTWYSGQHQSQIHIQYQEEVGKVADSTIQQAKLSAIAYNEAIIPGVQMAESFSQDALLQAAKDYVSQLNLTDNGVMGYVKVPSIDVILPIYHGTEDATLEHGAGHLLGTSLPVGGASTHTVLTAHSGMATQKLFSDLPQLKIGDVFYLEVLGETLAYQVDQIKTVLPHDTTCLGIAENEDYCTLVTCTPFGINTHRLLVRGSRIPYEEAEEIEEQTGTPEPLTSTWEKEYVRGLCMGVEAVAFTAVTAITIRMLRRRRKH